MKGHNLLTFDCWSDLHCRLFWGYAGHPPDFARRMRYPGWPPAAWLILRGSVRLGDKNEAVTAAAGQWVFPANRPCRQRFSAGAEIISIRFSIMWHSGLLLFDNKSSMVFAADRFPELESSARELLAAIKENLGHPKTNLRRRRESAETFFSVMRAFYRWNFQYVHAMSSLGLQPSAPPTEQDSRVEAALAWLRDRPFTQPWREPELSRWCGVSVSQLNRLFVSHHGLTPIAFYEVRRYEAATGALLETELDIKSIAYDLGFSSPGNFSTWFKRKSGKSPLAFRRQASGDIRKNSPTAG